MKPHPLPLILAAAAIILSSAHADPRGEFRPSSARKVTTAKLPNVAGLLPNQTFTTASDIIIIGDLDNYFTGNGLTYSVTVAGDAVATFFFDSRNVLSLIPAGSAGTATMTVTATDDSQKFVQAAFTVTVAASHDSGYRLTKNG